MVSVPTCKVLVASDADRCLRQARGWLARAPPERGEMYGFASEKLSMYFFRNLTSLLLMDISGRHAAG